MDVWTDEIMIGCEMLDDENVNLKVKDTPELFATGGEEPGG